MFEENMEAGRWWSMPPDEAPDFGDLPDAGRRGPKEWRAEKRQKNVIAHGLDRIGKAERALAMRNCCSCFRKHKYERGSIIKCNSECRDLLCPSGMRLRARKHLRSMTAAIGSYLDRHAGMQGLFVTLTLKNCPAHQLRATVGCVIAAYGALTRTAAVKRAVQAWVRSIELTRNRQTREFHVHVHSVWFVNRAAYFKKNSLLFITVQRLRELWQKRLRVDYLPIADIRPLRGVLSPLDDEGRKSLREVLKYTLKPGVLVVSDHDRPQLVGADDYDLYDPGDGQGLRPMRCVPLRAVCDALRSRRLVASSASLQGVNVPDFADDPDESLAPGADLGAFICTEIYVWRSRGRDEDYFLIARDFDEPHTGRGGRPLRP